MIKVRNNYSGSKSIDIDINKNVTVSLRRDQYDELIAALEISMAEKVKESDNYRVRVENKSKECLDFIRKIRDVFYDMDVPGFGIKRDLKEINIDDLEFILDKYSSLLGFE